MPGAHQFISGAGRRARLDKVWTFLQEEAMSDPNHVITVCTTCGDAGMVDRAGAQLLSLVEDSVAVWSEREHFRVRGTECMSACRRPCAVSFIAAGKYSYLFGELAPEDADVVAILECARLYRTQDDGLMPWSARPERLRRNVIARIPPLSVDP